MLLDVCRSEPPYWWSVVKTCAYASSDSIRHHTARLIPVRHVVVQVNVVEQKAQFSRNSTTSERYTGGKGMPFFLSSSRSVLISFES